MRRLIEDRAGESGLGAQHLQGSARGTDRGGSESGVEDERAGGVDEVFTHPGVRENHTPLGGQRFRQGGGDDHVRLPGQTRLVDEPAAARSPDPDPVGFVDEEECAVGAARLVQVAQRGKVAVGAEHRIGEDQRPRFGACGEGAGDRPDVTVRGDDDPRPGQPARVDERCVASRVGDDDGVPARQRGDSAEIGGVSAREHQSGFCAGELGEFAFEQLVFGGGARDQSRSGGAAAPAA